MTPANRKCRYHYLGHFLTPFVLEENTLDFFREIDRMSTEFVKFRTPSCHIDLLLERWTKTSSMVNLIYVVPFKQPSFKFPLFKPIAFIWKFKIIVSSDSTVKPRILGVFLMKRFRSNVPKVFNAKKSKRELLSTIAQKCCREAKECSHYNLTTVILLLNPWQEFFSNFLSRMRGRLFY